MTTNNHTPIATGAAANASTVNAPLSELDSAITNVEATINSLGLTGAALITRSNGGANSGATSLIVLDTTGFANGDTVGFVTSTGYQERAITVVNATTISVAAINGDLADAATIAFIPPAFQAAATSGEYANISPTIVDTMDASLGDVYRPERFAALAGSGTELSPHTATDQTAGIQTAINAIQRGGQIALRSRRYDISHDNGIRINKPHVDLVGEAIGFNDNPDAMFEGTTGGTKLKFTGADGGIKLGSLTPGLKIPSISLRKLYIWGDEPNTSGIAADKQTDQVQIDMCHVGGFRYGLAISDVCDAWHIRDCSFLGCQDGIAVLGGDGVVGYSRIVNCEISDNYGYGIYCDPAATSIFNRWLRVIGCTLVRNCRDDSLAYTDPANVYWGMNYSIFANNVVRDAGYNETGYLTASGIIVDGSYNQINDNYFGDHPGAAILIRGNNNIVSGNTFSGNGNDVEVESGATGNIIYASPGMKIKVNSGAINTSIINSIGVSITDAGTNTQIVGVKSAARARLSANQTNVAFQTPTKILLDTEDYDVTNQFASYKFTVPLTGRYAIEASILYNNTAVESQKRYQCSIYINGSEACTGALVSVAASQYITAKCSDIRRLNFGDTIELYVFHTATGAQTVLADAAQTFLAVCALD